MHHALKLLFHQNIQSVSKISKKDDYLRKFCIQAAMKPMKLIWRGNTGSLSIQPNRPSLLELMHEDDRSTFCTVTSACFMSFRDVHSFVSLTSKMFLLMQYIKYWTKLGLRVALAENGMVHALSRF